jgi:endonuclease/exonuclease/phosphatase family metal-dependent hydrolase
MARARLISGLLLLAACTPPAGGDGGDSGCEACAQDSGETGIGGPDTAPPELTVLSLNLHCLMTSGTDFPDNRARLEALAEAVQAEGVQIIALQELCISPKESASSMLEEALEGATGQGWSITTAFAHTAWEGTDDEAEEHVGLAVRGELHDERGLDLHVQEGLRRVGVQGLWESGEGTIALTSVHLDHQHEDARLGQARQVAVEALVTGAGAASLVLGDFNARPGSPTTGAMEAMGFIDAGDRLDDDRIDYVWHHRGAPLALVESRRIFTGQAYPTISDHPGMLARFEGGAGETVQLTTLRTDHDTEGGFLALRGDHSPLSWDHGWPASRSGERWTAAFTEIDGDFAYKWLLDDSWWQLGDDLQGQAGQDNLGSVSF